MKSTLLIFLLFFIVSCNSKTQEKSVNSKADTSGNKPKDSIYIAQVIRNIIDTNINNTTGRTIEILFNGIEGYLGGHRNPKVNFATECMVCEPVQIYKRGLLFGRRLYITSDSVIAYPGDRDISDTANIVSMKSYYAEKKPRKYKFSQGNLTMKYQGQSCNDADFVSVNLSYDQGIINLNNLINASFFEYDLDNNGVNEQYLFGARNCSQELVFLRIREDKSL